MALGIPAPTTLAAEAITANQARLRATALSDTNETETVFTFFRIGTTAPPADINAWSYDSEVLATPDTVVYPLTNDVPFSAMATNLTCETRYYYQAGLRTAGPIVLSQRGNVLDFTTQPCSAPPPNPIPTLNDRAQILMMLALILMGGLYRWNRNSR